MDQQSSGQYQQSNQHSENQYQQMNQQPNNQYQQMNQQSVNQYQQGYQQSVWQQQGYQQPSVYPIAQNQNNVKYGVVGTGEFIGLKILFAIPFVGWLICLVLAFAAAKDSVKHYARAEMIFVILEVAITVFLYINFMQELRSFLSGVLYFLF